MGTDAAEVWGKLVSVVMDSRGDWRRSVSEATGLPFTRVRALKRLGEPRTMADLADRMGVDAPAATVAVNDLEARGLVLRRPHPGNRRAKLVELTPAGRRVLDTVHAVADRPPAGLAALGEDDLAALAALLDRISAP
ncbi:MarR family winged helix-turn-helix transcriptional regulator [Amycolatopsis sp. CA-230715]|uniref:MarR family winged helix-turn-helix transcriptional regulator n=1 Tax=Amycolatopsis sp. CA-230715 TaxID=2745196 RepID=UPI001C022399|nr:MarR family transcriptional regulator [Amycolatopsis sp. CA-230715]